MAELVDGFRGLGLVGGKKGAKKGGNKKGAVRSPQKVVNQGRAFVSFKNNDPLKAYITTERPGDDVKDINTHEAVLKTFQNPTKNREWRAVLFFDGTYELFLSDANAYKIPKKEGKRVKANLAAVWVGEENLATFFASEAEEHEEGDEENE
eukprot:g69536.t1